MVIPNSLHKQFFGKKWWIFPENRAHFHLQGKIGKLKIVNSEETMTFQQSCYYLPYATLEIFPLYAILKIMVYAILKIFLQFQSYTSFL